MKRILLVTSLLLAGLSSMSAQQVDSSKLQALDSMLQRYVKALETEGVESKYEECDFMISACTDSILRQHTALRLYDHYYSSKFMGDEAVAIHIYDKWFAGKKVKMKSDVDLLNAGIFAEFNRETLIGMKAPVVELTNMEGAKVESPLGGKYTVLYFYDTDCSTCKVESPLLKMLLDRGLFDVRLDAVYVGDNEVAWKEYVAETLNVESPKVEVRNLWDPENQSDFLRAYGLLQTPRMFLVAPDGRVVGRMLNTEALFRLLLVYLQMDEEE